MYILEKTSINQNDLRVYMMLKKRHTWFGLSSSADFELSENNCYIFNVLPPCYSFILSLVFKNYMHLSVYAVEDCL